MARERKPEQRRTSVRRGKGRRERVARGFGGDGRSASSISVLPTGRDRTTEVERLAGERRLGVEALRCFVTGRKCQLVARGSVSRAEFFRNRKMEGEGGCEADEFTPSDWRTDAAQAAPALRRGSGRCRTVRNVARGSGGTPSPALHTSVCGGGRGRTAEVARLTGGVVRPPWVLRHSWRSVETVVSTAGAAAAAAGAARLRSGKLRPGGCRGPRTGE
jgi:hypothetical protein